MYYFHSQNTCGPRGRTKTDFVLFLYAPITDTVQNVKSAANIAFPYDEHHKVVNDLNESNMARLFCIHIEYNQDRDRDQNNRRQ